MSKLTEAQTAKLKSAVAYYQKQAKNSGLKGSLISKVAGLFGVTPRALMRELLDNQVPLANTQGHMAETKKKKKKKKAKGATPTPTNPGYSANAGLAATGGVGMGGGSGAAGGASESIVKSAKSKIDEHFSTCIFDEAMNAFLDESHPEIVDKVAASKKKSKPGVAQQVNSRIKNATATSINKFKGALKSLGEEDTGVARAWDYSLAKAQTIDDIKAIIRMHDKGLDTHSRNALYHSAKQRAKDFGHYKTMHEGWDDSIPGDFGAEVDKAEQLLNQIDEYYDITWKDMSEEMDFSDIGLGSDVDPYELGYDISGQFPSEIRRKDGQAFTDRDLENVGNFGDAWNIQQREIMSNQVEINPVNITEYAVQFVLGML